MNKRALEKVLLTIMAGAMVFVSCVDKDYDLSNLDTTIGIGTGTTLRLPISSTGGLVLRNIFDLADDSPIDTINVNGDMVYFLDKGDTTKTNINIGDIVINAPSLGYFNNPVPQTIVPAAVKAARRSPVTGIQYLYNFEGLADVSYNATTSTTIDASVIDIRHAGFEDGLTIDFNINVLNNGRLERVHFDSLAIEIPAGFDILDASFMEFPINDSNLSSIQGEVSTTDNGTTLITFFSPAKGGDENGFLLSSVGVFSISLGGVSFGDGSLISFNPETHRASLAAGSIQIHGYMLASEDDIDISNPTAEELAAINAGDYAQLLPTELTFHGDGTFSSAIKVTTFSGHIRHTVANIENITLNHLPDFLEGDDVTLDLQNPQIYLDIFTDLATICSTDITITPYRDNVQSAEGLSANIIYDGSLGNHKAIMLAQNTFEVSFPAEYADYAQERQSGKDVGSLIRRIPNYIKVTGKDNNPSIIIDLPNCENVVINKSYKVDLGYRVYSPLNFGPNFQIVYRDKEENFDLGDDLDKLDLDFIQVEGLAISDIPLGVKLTITPLTKTGVPIPNLKVLYKSGAGAYVADGFSIRANADGSPQDMVGMRMQAAQGHELNEFLREGPNQLDGIEFKAVLNNPTDASALKTKARIKLKDLVFSIMGNYIIND